MLSFWNNHHMKLTQQSNIKDIIYKQDENLGFFYGVCPWCKEILIVHDVSPNDSTVAIVIRKFEFISNSNFLFVFFKNF